MRGAFVYLVRRVGFSVEPVKEKIMQHCIQCVDRISGQVGDFLHHGDLHAVSPVFDDLQQLFAYMRANRLRLVPGTLWDVEPIPAA